jgi:endonuclease YncB( thermonuclease family)
MPWPNIWPFNGSEKDDNDSSIGASTSEKVEQVEHKVKEQVTKLKDHIHSTSWTNFTQPTTIVSTIALTSVIILSGHFYKRYLRRIPTVQHIRPSALRRTSIFGKVTSVGDGDNFRLFHTPGGRLAGWGWLPGRTVPTKKADLQNNTLSIRIAGIDAPELAHFGKPSQPFGQEALDFLRTYLMHKRVRAYIYSKDQYERVVGTVWVREWGIRRDVGLEMLKRGLATVYEAKSGSEFGGKEKQYREAERMARERAIGMWKEPSAWERLMGTKKKIETPREYKTRMSELGKGKNQDTGTIDTRRAAKPRNILQRFFGKT